MHFDTNKQFFRFTAQVQTKFDQEPLRGINDGFEKFGIRGWVCHGSWHMGYLEEKPYLQPVVVAGFFL